jgi:DNA invertase Pin-like site-specific DNA recombinase
VLEPAIDIGGSMGRMVLTLLGMVAEMELGFIRDRQRAGIDAAKAKGVYKGRPATFDRARVVSLRKEGMTGRPCPLRPLANLSTAERFLS